MVIAFGFRGGRASAVARDSRRGEDVTTTGGAGYYIRERVAENDLGYLIKHFTDHSTTIRNNAEYLQQVNVLEVPAATPAKIISYANLRNHKWTLTSVRKLAEQFEEENPDWKVIAAVNADFFDINGILNGLPYQTHNPVVTMGEFYKTSVRTNVLGFTNDGSTNTLIAGGKNVRTPNMILAVYDDDDEIIAEFDIEKLTRRPAPAKRRSFSATTTTKRKNTCLWKSRLTAPRAFSLKTRSSRFPTTPMISTAKVASPPGILSPWKRAIRDCDEKPRGRRPA